jgi:1-deoxy-D-xylulose-5-phosphate synthase
LNDSHIGILDIPLLGNIPNLTYLAPANKEEYISMLDWSIEQNNVPVAIRVPWTGVTRADYDVQKDYDTVSYKIVNSGEKICIIALGGFFELGKKTALTIKERTGIEPTLINPRFITGVDEDTLDWVQKNHEITITIEDGILSGGFGSKIAQYYSHKQMKVYNFGFSTNIPRVYDAAELMHENHLSDIQIADIVLSDSINDK